MLVTNAAVDPATAEEIDKLFFEIIIAPAYDPEALEILKSKKNRIILIQKNDNTEDLTIRTALNGVLVQDRDLSTEIESEMKPATKTLATAEQLADLVFANKIVKHTKSNAIVLAKNQQLVASGVGQTSRVDALKQSIADSVEIALNAGVRAVVQPGGSVRDQDSIDFCDAHGMAMVFTGIRHFKH